MKHVSTPSTSSSCHDIQHHINLQRREESLEMHTVALFWLLSSFWCPWAQRLTGSVSALSCSQKLGQRHSQLTMMLAEELLCLHPYFDSPEPDTEDPACILWWCTLSG